MTYREVEDYLFRRLAMFSRSGAEAYKPGLETTISLSEYFGSPHRKIKAIHIAGTNGKGSTSHTLAAILQSAGYNVGLYTSPHLQDFRERIRVNGEKIPEDDVIKFVEKFRCSELAKRLSPSFFELTTIMAFDYFARKGVDVAVVETGLGGRLDSTNILTNKVVTIITNISLDHTNLLGATEPQIAFEKAGIFAEGVPAIIGNAGEPDVRQVFINQAKEKNVENLEFVSDKIPFDAYEFLKEGVLYKNTPYGDLIGELSGDCQPENTSTVLVALRLLRETYPKITIESIKEGFQNVCSLTGLMGRWMKIKIKGRNVICDTAHNIGGWKYLEKRLKDISQSGNLSMVVGFVNDKDIVKIVNLMPRRASYYFTEPEIERKREAIETSKTAIDAGLPEGKVFQGDNAVARAFTAALDESKEGDTIFVGGSTFVVADFLKSLQITQK